jgi:hypothetical protein
MPGCQDGKQWSVTAPIISVDTYATTQSGFGNRVIKERILLDNDDNEVARRGKKSPDLAEPRNI